MSDGQSTTHLTVADRWGNVVAYTLTIESTGGNGIVVPGRGFLLNNELTDFNFTADPGRAPDPNLPGPGKRPRSSMSPTIVLADGEPFLAVGSPGGSTIITTVLQILVNRIDLGMTLPDALAAPRATQRNTAAVAAEPAFLRRRRSPRSAALGHTFSTTAEIGAATGIERLGTAVAGRGRAGPARGGAAAVVRPNLRSSAALACAITRQSGTSMRPPRCSARNASAARVEALAVLRLGKPVPLVLEEQVLVRRSPSPAAPRRSARPRPA